MKRACLFLALLLCAFAPHPAKAGGVLVVVDSFYVDNKNNYAPFFDLLGRSLRPGKKLTITTVDASAAYAEYSLADLVDGVSSSGASPKLDYDLIVCVDFNDNDYLYNTARRYPIQLTKAVNRPKVPVLYIGFSNALNNGSGDDSLGVSYAPTVATISASSPLVTSPAGFAFPAKVDFAIRRSTGAGLYVTPVLWLYGYSYTKANPRGVGGNSDAASDTLCAWFYNPPIASTRTGVANAAGYGIVNWEASSGNGGATNYPSSALGAVAVGMAAKLAPTLFKFPAQNVALDIDDGCMLVANAFSDPQVMDGLAGFDSLGVWRIPYAVGINVDSMGTGMSNGLTRFQNTFQAARKYNMGRFTVHTHFGMTAGGAITDTTAITTAGGVYGDIFGVGTNRYPFGSTTGTTRDQSTYMQLVGATRKLVQYAGDANLVTKHVMAPTDDYSTRLVGLGGFGAMMDSTAYAIALAGYRVVRTQYLADQYHFGTGNTGGFGRGFAYNLPSIVAIGANLTPAVVPTTGSLLFAPSRYLWGTTTDTVSANAYASMRSDMNNLIGTAVGFNRNYDMTTAGEAASANLRAYVGVAKGVIWVTHLPNWRAGIGVSALVSEPYGGSRPAWENVRQVNGVMEAAKWCAQQANTGTTTYFTDGPMKWVYPDQITIRDVR